MHMIAEQRFAHIIEAVEQRGTVTVTELAAELETSESTVRRDLEKLAAMHRLLKVHGGATRLEDAHVVRDLTLSERSELHTAEKDRIVRYAASLVQPDDFVYVDSGSTTRELVACLAETQATYVTDSVFHAACLADRGLRVLVLGGEVKAATRAAVGPDAVEMLARYHFTLGFWGANGISAEHGCTTPDRNEAEVKWVALAHTAPGRRFVLADASKFGRVAPVTFAALSDVTVVTTERPAGFEDCDNIMVA